MNKPDFSKWLPILISLIAVGISCLSWWEAHRGRVIQEGLSRPQFRVEKAELVIPPGNLGLDLRNVGKIPGKLSTVIFVQRTDLSDGPCVISASILNPAKTYSLNISEINEILPGDSQHVSRKLPLTTGCKAGQVMVGTLELEYRNTVTWEIYTQATEIEIKIISFAFGFAPSPSPSASPSASPSSSR